MTCRCREEEDGKDSGDGGEEGFGKSQARAPLTAPYYTAAWRSSAEVGTWLENSCSRMKLLDVLKSREESFSNCLRYSRLLYTNLCAYYFNMLYHQHQHHYQRSCRSLSPFPILPHHHHSRHPSS
ncbi:hypothetical protein JI435_120980 [Parastagonospora nodorum SN15]|uniref:Uncharacterized protein n=1 Tax=Phaeosphaeria nodorum (strain SN15 / ATCC MYA-4574 / FGSC 10173) TaxID=321614 RepID=A0A7U2FAH8_PHANO|nr:hypothetical protein JI435_120980 [Parastagonospora nodorum SN15]